MLTVQMKPGASSTEVEEWRIPAPLMALAFSRNGNGNVGRLNYGRERASVNEQHSSTGEDELGVGVVGSRLVRSALKDVETQSYLY